MKKSAFTIVILLSVSALFAQMNVTASGDVITKEYNQQPFTAVDIRFVGDVVIHQGPVHKTTVTANENVIQYVHFRVENGKLFVYTDDNLSFFKVKTFLVEIYTPKMEELSVCGAKNTRIEKKIGKNTYTRGAGDVTVEGRDESQLTVMNIGSANCTLKCMKIEKSLELHNKGAGDIIVPSAGVISTQTLLINNTGSGDVIIQSCSVSHSLVVNNKGAGDITMDLLDIPTEELILQNKGAGDLLFRNVWAKNVIMRNHGAGDVQLMGKTEEVTLESTGAGDASLKQLKSETAHITHSGVGDVIAYVKGTAYLTNKSRIGKVYITGGGKVISE